MSKNRPVEITPSVQYIGAFDQNIRTFDIIMKTANGTSYNSYLVRGSEGVAVIDTVKKEFEEQFFDKLEQLCFYDEIKYIILNHLEPDHSGAIFELMKRAPDAKIIIAVTAKSMLKALIKSDIEFTTAQTGDKISLGDKTLEFLSTPFLHWPDTMSTYLVEEKILFSGDVFGCHFYDPRLFDDKVGDFDYAFKYYYEHIMRPFKRFVVSALELYATKEIALIAPAHGPILRNKPEKFMALYGEWSSEAKFAKKEYHYKHVNIFYVSSYGNTRAMAEQIYLGADSVDGIRASIYDMEALEMNNMITLLEESDVVVVGSPTINADAVKPAWDLLSCMAFLESRGKIGAVFGSYGWSGEAQNMIYHRMRGLKFRTPLEPLKFKLIPTKEELGKCYEFGAELSDIANGKSVEMSME